MRWLRRSLSAARRQAPALLVFMGLAMAAAAPQASGAAKPGVVLDDAQQMVEAQDTALVWLDAGGTASLDHVLKAGTAAFRPARPDQIHSLGEQGALWLHYRVLRGRDQRHGWLLVFPMPVLDSVTVYQQDARGQWVGQAAGDTLAVATWAEPGRYPHFRLDLPPGQARDIYVRIRHLTPANFPIQFLSESAYDQRVQIEYLGLGLTFGALMLLIAACLAQAFVYRDGVYAWYAAYALVTAVGVTSYTGVAGHLLWPGFGTLGDSPQGCLALLAAAAALLFVRNLIGISARHPIADQLVLWSGLSGIALAAIFPSLPKSPGLVMLAIYVAGATLTNVSIAYAAWRRGDEVGGWVLLAYMPLTLAVGMALVRLFGWLPVSFGTQYAIVVAMALEVPLLLVALNIRSRERHGAQIRELALSSQDALTGLLAPHLFHDRLRQVVARHKRDKKNSAVVFIDLVNYPRIKDYYGSAVAEQSLLRSVIKLRRLLRDVDTVSRIGEARFGLILEGVTSRIAVTDRAARLIAAGLMPLQGLKPDVTLQFHIGAVLLDERMAEAPELAEALDGLLSGMSPRTRRPIRFLEPQNTEPAPLGSDSSLFESESEPPNIPPQPGAAKAAVSRSASPP
ncbi:MAG: 7TM diverse intracellular signaling domain-containing protein [Ramlibacter sp.]|nr:7TM diverse intracellular signaling domain-containing protein [Ramlibacter sp.]